MRDGRDWTKLSFIFIRTRNATNIIKVRPAAAKNPVAVEVNPVIRPAAPIICKNPVSLRFLSFRPNLLNSSISVCDISD